MVSLHGYKRAANLGGFKTFRQQEQIGLDCKKARFYTLIFRTRLKTRADLELGLEASNDFIVFSCNKILDTIVCYRKYCRLEEVMVTGGAREKCWGASATKEPIVSGVNEFSRKNLSYWLKKLRKGHRYYESADRA